MPTSDDLVTLEHLADVSHLYERYVELAGLARMPTVEELDAEQGEVPGIAPLGLCIRHG